MLRTFAFRPTRRRGSVLIVVLAMLVLFAVLGLSFVLYSESQLSAARSQKISVSIDSEPNPLLALEGWMGPFIYDKGDTGDDLMDPIRGHSLSRSKYGAGGSFVPFGGSPLPMEAITLGAAAFADSRQIVRFTWDQGNAAVFDPERVYGATPPRNSPAGPLVGTYQAKAYPFTYPDRHDFYLASQNPTTGEITTPSFHRWDLFGSLDPTNANWASPQGKYLTLRPRPADHPNFPPVPMNADGTYTGDVANMRFITGSQRNDSLWMYAGGPVRRWREKNYVACVAPLVLDLNSRVNLAAAGNAKGTGATHASKEGWGPWEVNPVAVGMTAADVQAVIQRRYGKTGTDYTPPVDPYTAAASTARVNGQYHPLFTGGRLPRQGSLFDADGVGPAANDGSLTLPLTGGFQTTPIFNNPLVVAAPFRHEPNQLELTTVLSNHPSQYNALLYGRQPTPTPIAPAIGAGGFGHDDLLKLAARFSDPKARQATTSSVPVLGSLNPVADTAAAQQARALTTTFSVSQQWAVAAMFGRLTTDAAGVLNPVRLGPVDLNRPLPDYRKNPTLPPSPVNLWNPAVPAELPYWYAAHSARQRLARDIFIRLAARYGLVQGTNAIYYTDTGNVEVLTDPATDATGNTLVLMRIAQFAVNLVDSIDGDDIITPFVWRPTPASARTADPANDPTNGAANFAPTDLATRVVFGTEQPRLVINEVYSGIFNDRADPNPLPTPRAAQPLERRYWVELHNPTPADPTHADAGGARLKYENLVTPVLDPTTGAAVPGGYPGATYNPYRLEVAVVPAGTTAPYRSALLTALNTGGYGAAAMDTQTVFGVNGIVSARVNTFVHDGTAPSAPATLAATPDELNLVRPATAASGPVGGNAGYYLIGPKDAFPSANATCTMTLPDAPAGVPPLGAPPAPVNALSFDATAGAPSGANITAEAAKTSTVLLRRVLNPYLPPQEDPTLANFNPFVTVDFVENIPTRDRTTHNSAGAQPAALNLPTVGRIHPFAAFPDYGTAVVAPQVTAVQDQIAPAYTTSPPHTFFNLNNQTTLENTRGTPATYGFEWMPHLDRELVSLPEGAHASRTSPALLTSFFFNGTPGTGYHGHAVGLNSPLGVTINGAADNIRMLTDAEGLLTTGSRLPGVPLGGREAGKLNLNTMNDVRVFNAVLDPQGGNGFAATYPVTIWDNYIRPAAPPVAPLIARTANVSPRMTVHEGGTDYPFAFGSTSLTTGVNPPRDHPFGRSADPTTNPNGLIFPNYAAPPAPAIVANHPYLANEPLRKAWNSLTPTSDGFLVLVTVGFFEVTLPNPALPASVTNQPILGAELHDKTPGDLRAQYAAVVDRSQLATQVVQTDPTTGLALGTSSAVAADPATNPIGRGVQTKLVDDVARGANTVHIEAIPGSATAVAPDGTAVAAGTCAILGDGVVYRLGAGSRVRVGYGDSAVSGGGDGEWLTVQAVAQRQLPDATGTLQNVPGQVTLTLAAGVQFSHAAGDPVGNVVFGNPGPQPGVTLAQLRQRGLVPYFTRMEP